MTTLIETTDSLGGCVIRLGPDGLGGIKPPFPRCIILQIPDILLMRTAANSPAKITDI